MILCDTGPLVALIDRDDPYHTQSVAALNTLPASPAVIPAQADIQVPAPDHWMPDQVRHDGSGPAWL